MTEENISHELILGSTITGYVSISAFASLVGIPTGIRISANGLKICAIAAAIKKNISRWLRRIKRSTIK